MEYILYFLHRVNIVTWLCWVGKMDDANEVTLGLLVVVLLQCWKRDSNTSLCEKLVDGIQCCELLYWLELLFNEVVVLQFIVQLQLTRATWSAVHDVCYNVRLENIFSVMYTIL